MTVAEIIESVQFVVDQEGKPTAAVMNMRQWESLLALLEDLEDTELVQTRLSNWRSKEGWSRWDDFEAELDADALPALD